MAEGNKILKFNPISTYQVLGNLIVGCVYYLFFGYIIFEKYEKEVEKKIAHCNFYSKKTIITINSSVLFYKTIIIYTCPVKWHD